MVGKFLPRFLMVVIEYCPRSLVSSTQAPPIPIIFPMCVSLYACTMYLGMRAERSRLGYMSLPSMYMKRFGLVCSFINASVLNCAGSTELKDFSTSSTPAVWCSSL